MPLYKQTEMGLNDHATDFAYDSGAAAMSALNSSHRPMPSSDDATNDGEAGRAPSLPQHLQRAATITFDPDIYPVHELVSKILLGEHAGKVMLQDLHTLPEFQAKKRGRPKLSYQRYRNKGPHRDNEFRDEFRYQIGRFVDEVVRPLLTNGELVYQREPVLRVQVPHHEPLGNRHRDEDYGRQPTEINLWLPLTPVFGTNSLWTETERGLRDWHPFTAPGPGHCMRFWGSQCEHFTKANTTEVTRVSLDFRVVPEDLFIDNYTSPISQRGTAMRRGESYTDTIAERKWRKEIKTPPS